jgi:hypothetical protein
MAKLKRRATATFNRGLGERLTAAGYHFSIAVENIAVGCDLDKVIEHETARSLENDERRDARVGRGMQRRRGYPEQGGTPLLDDGAGRPAAVSR